MSVIVATFSPIIYLPPLQVADAGGRAVVERRRHGTYTRVCAFIGTGFYDTPRKNFSHRRRTIRDTWHNDDVCVRRMRRFRAGARTCFYFLCMGACV
jgi:hypothetical protein